MEKFTTKRSLFVVRPIVLFVVFAFVLTGVPVIPVSAHGIPQGTPGQPTNPPVPVDGSQPPVATQSAPNLNEPPSSVTLSTCTVHCNDPEPIQAEHHAIHDLVRDEIITHTAVRSGLWSDASIWEGGAVPQAGARIKIAEGVEVKLDFVNKTPIERLRIDGKLTFATNVDTGLVVNTLVILHEGELEVGTEANPVQTGIEAKIIIQGQILEDDLNQIGLGILNHGRLTMWGEKKTEQATLLKNPAVNSKELELAEVPVNWRVGDVLIVAGLDVWKDRDQQLLITSINGNKVQVTGFKENGDVDPAWRGMNVGVNAAMGDFTTFVINVTRNVSVESALRALDQADSYGISRQRGHWMNMHSGVSKTKIGNVGIYGLGRTDKRTRLESVQFDEHGNLVPDTGHNQVGRYALHFHRGGPGNAPAIVTGIAIVDSPGLGLVNHSSNVHVSDSVAYKVVGSAFFTEAGDEKGFFENVAAIRMTGSGEGIVARTRQGGVVLETDFGHGGHGFWLQGGGVSLKNVKVAGARDAAIIFFTEGLNEGPGLGTKRVQVSDLDDPRVAGGSTTTVAVGDVPLHLNGAFVMTSKEGVQTLFHQLNANHGVPSVIENVIVAGGGMHIDYTHNLIIRDTTLLGRNFSFSGTGISCNVATRNITYEDLTIKGFGVGIEVPVNGKNIIRGGVFQNVKDIRISTMRDPNRTIDIEGDIQFLDIPNADKLGGKFEIYLYTDFDPKDVDITTLFSRSIIRLGTVRYNGKQLYFYAQAADFVPFKSGEAKDYVPLEFLDKTNQQLWDEFGLAIGDAIAPANAIVDPKIHGLVGDPPKFAPEVNLHHKHEKYTTQLDRKTVRVEFIKSDGTKEIITIPQPAPLKEGWNVITFDVTDSDGVVYKRSVMIFGDITPPTFVIDRKLDLRINPEDLKNGFTVTGTNVDNSGNNPEKTMFKGEDLVKLPRQVGADGLEYVELKFTIHDKAGNKTDVVLQLKLDPNKLPARVAARKILPKRIAAAIMEFLMEFRGERAVLVLPVLP